MSHAIAHIDAYDALWQSQRTRQRPMDRLKGLDAVAARLFVRAKASRLNTSHWREMATRVEALSPKWQGLDDEALAASVSALRESFRRRRNTPDQLLDAAAAVRELAYRHLGQRPYGVQLMGALAIVHGQVVEMATGEGKTLTAAVAGSLLAWSWPTVHVVTANEYLAARDAKWMEPLYRAAGVSVGAVVPGMEDALRAATFRRAVVYTTQKELVGDWLRDHLSLSRISDAVTERLAPPRPLGGADGQDQPRNPGVRVPGLHAVIVDEADAVLIDSAVTPLIIAMARGKSRLEDAYRRAADLATALVEKSDFEIELKGRRCKLTEAGKQKVASLLTPTDIGPWRAPRRRHELIEQGLAAIHCYKRGEQYDMVEGRVTMIDEFTGRFQPDRHWQHGMHQAVQAKEGLEIEGDGRSLASLSFQRFFRMYPLLSGMTGTAWDAKSEFEQTYRVPVRKIPTHRPLLRVALPSRFFATSEARWKAVAQSVAQQHAKGRPVLVGTRSVAASQHLSELLTALNVKHQVLNAINHEQEAQIVELAGMRDAVTVATNMAGRGTDIKLGPGVSELGGLHVILTERHDSSRIDRQLIGRSGRQGDPGSSQVMVSLEDSLLQKNVPSLASSMASIAKPGEHGEISFPGLESLFRLAQRRAQGEAFNARKQILLRDDWIERTMPG